MQQAIGYGREEAICGSYFSFREGPIRRCMGTLLGTSGEWKNEYLYFGVRSAPTASDRIAISFPG